MEAQNLQQQEARKGSPAPGYVWEFAHTGRMAGGWLYLGLGASERAQGMPACRRKREPPA